MMIFVAGYLIADALEMTFFANNMWWFPHFVNNGDLDYYITRPISSLFFLSVRDFAADSFLNVLMTFGILFLGNLALSRTHFWSKACSLYSSSL